MSKRVIRLTESELKRYIHKVISEQGVKDPLEGWDKLKEGQKIVLKSDKDGSITSWIVDATSPNPGPFGSGTKLFLYPDDEESRKLTRGSTEVSFFPKEMKVNMMNGMNSIVKNSNAIRNNNRPQMRTPPPQQTFRINPTLSFDQNVYIIQQQIRRDLTHKEKSQIDKAITDFKTRSSLQPTPQQSQLIAQRVQQSQQNLRRNLTPSEIDYIKSTVMNQSQQQGPPPQQGQRFN